MLIKSFLFLFLTIFLISCSNNIRINKTIETESKKNKIVNYNSLDINKYFSKLENKKEIKKIINEKAIPINGLKIIEDKNTNNELKFFFFSDSHSKYQTLNKFNDIINKEKPDFVLDGGDTVYDGTEAELDKAYKFRQNMKVPVYLVNGSHDVYLNGIFKKLPLNMPTIQSFDVKGVHFILLDNESYGISDELFKIIESDLEINKNKTIIFAMHVPIMTSNDSVILKIWKNLHLPMGSLTMRNEDEINHFTSLMNKYKVSLILTGHTHKFDESIKDGVKYITTGSTGGLTSGLNIHQEFLDINIKDGKIDIKRVKLKEGSKNPITFLADTFFYLQDINLFNHNALGWNYYPSSNIQYDLGARITEIKKSENISSILSATIGRNISSNILLFSSFKLITGLSDLNFQLNAGLNYTFIGDYNRGLFLNSTIGCNTGIINRDLSSGLQFGVATGLNYENFTFSFGFEKATNYNAKTA